MNTREMALNHASLSVGDRAAAVDFLKDVVSGIGQLVSEGVVGGVLRASRDLREVPCTDDFSLFDAMQGLRRSGARDEYIFLVKMTTKMPLLSDIEADVKQRFLGCQARGLRPEDGEPLLLCVLTHSVAIGFPSHED